MAEVHGSMSPAPACVQFVPSDNATHVVPQRKGTA